jgi:hypothetical protein
MTTDLQESIEAAAPRVGLSPSDRGGAVDGADPVQPALPRRARATSLALAGKSVAIPAIYPSNSLSTGGSPGPGWR